MAFVIIDDPVGGLSSTVRCGSSNNARSPYSTVSGGALNTSSGKYSTISGGYLNTTNKDYSVIGGGLYNTTIDAFNTIGGGSRNTSQKNYSTIGGGFSNTTNGCFTTIAGGRNNKSQANYSTIIGGCNNIANGIGSMVFGFDNTANGYNSVVLGGSNIVGNNNDTVYVPYLNISFLQTGTSVNNLGIDVNGNVVTGGLQPDVYITGGTIDYNTGDLTLDNNNSTSVVISGLQDIYATGGTFTLNTLTIENNDGSSFDVTGFTSGGGGGYQQVTFDQLYSLYTGLTLTPGSFYLITDFQTCYDQPNFDSTGSPITTGNYKTGNTESLVVLATAPDKLASNAYSLDYPNDKIKYDITFITTEVTGSPAKGRITERIDEKNNRADYDFRNVQFIRYHGFFSETVLPGKIDIDSFGIVTGYDTTFNSTFVVGDIFGVYLPFASSDIGGFRYYEIVSISGDTLMEVTGNSIYNYTNTYYSRGVNLPIHMNPFQCNVLNPTYTGFTEYYTFNNGDNYNTYLGDNSDYNTFLLSNNVFQSGTYYHNYFEGNVVGNTFNDDMDSNTCGAYFEYNIITNDFDDNIVGSHFNHNIIDCDMDGNIISDNFSFNMLGDSDGYDFDYNIVSWGFRYNFLTLDNDDFSRNQIGPNFNVNIIDSSFENNVIGSDFYNNYIVYSSFDTNNIGYNFNNNKITQSFDRNNVESNFNSNILSGGTFNDNKTGNDFNGNILRDSNFSNNTIDDNFNTNNIYSNFQRNRIGLNSGLNNFYSTVLDNMVDYMFQNNIGLSYSVGSTNFEGNQFNQIDSNNFSGNTIYNVAGNNFSNNNILGVFSYNTIGSYFYNNTIGDGFGYGFSTSQGNKIGNFFYSNTIGEYFYNNEIVDGFYLNTVVDYFQLNNVKTSLSSIDFTLSTHVYGNYNCEIFKRQDSNNRLSYYDGADVIQIVNIDA